ncbi:MAG: UbiA family prenyltransferase [Flavobacteriaceae bacterium]|jgi:hypothetical protein|uniref:UbiA family prenyltransferase n=1 Tax=Flavobacterium kayseriense TaxID=2764714 RepID=A0ABR7J5K8_9FLAO|nr:UbiA family prenyltransferase [Flavobacterium kayseriense]MBC5840811.1 UbiA family prenyltransferase [Flavobacterium kayseriense]MBC5846519.1 UbiA family prenyltransferase [Flavobacterium kayseriense]MBX9888736.1 UbiA family prenyltransferase [Flavobacteriaceae bacterium]
MKYLALIRYNDWWLYKVPFLLTIAYSTFYLADICVENKTLEIIKIITYIVSAAIYVSIINDITDMKIDRLVGKKNLFLGLPKSIVYTILSLAVILQLIVIYKLLDNGQSVYWYIAAVVAYSLYSIPPIRLKENRYLSIIADTCGAHAFPSMFIVTYINSITLAPLAINWTLIIFIWSFSYGLRGIIYHQYKDKENDLYSGILTLSNSLPIKKLKRLVLLVFAMELGSFIYLLQILNSHIIYKWLTFYSLIIIVRTLIYSSKIIIALPSSKFYQILLAEFYEVFLPISLLLSFTNCDNIWLVIICQLLLFPKRIITIYNECIGYCKRLMFFLCKARI